MVQDGSLTTSRNSSIDEWWHSETRRVRLGAATATATLARLVDEAPD